LVLFTYVIMQSRWNIYTWAFRKTNRSPR